MKITNNWFAKQMQGWVDRKSCIRYKPKTWIESIGEFKKLFTQKTCRFKLSKISLRVTRVTVQLTNYFVPYLHTKLTPDSEAAWFRQRHLPSPARPLSYFPFSISFSGSGTKSLSVARWGRERGRSQSFADASSSG